MQGTAGENGSPEQPGFEITRVELPDTVVLSLHGELDLSCIHVFEAAAQDAPRTGTLLLDLRDLEFMDSTGIRVIMNLQLRADAEGWALVLTNLQPQVLRMLRLCRVDERVRIAASEPP